MDLRGPFLLKDVPSIAGMLFKQDMLPIWSDGTRVIRYLVDGKAIVRRNGNRAIYFAPYQMVLDRDAKAMKHLVDKAKDAKRRKANPIRTWN